MLASDCNSYDPGFLNNADPLEAGYTEVMGYNEPGWPIYRFRVCSLTLAEDLNIGTDVATYVDPVTAAGKYVTTFLYTMTYYMEI